MTIFDLPLDPPEPSEPPDFALVFLYTFSMAIFSICLLLCVHRCFYRNMRIHCCSNLTEWAFVIVASLFLLQRIAVASIDMFAHNEEDNFPEIIFTFGYPLQLLMVAMLTLLWFSSFDITEHSRQKARRSRSRRALVIMSLPLLPSLLAHS